MKHRPTVNGTSRDYIAHQYGDDRNLAARQSIYSFQQPRLDLHGSSLDLAELTGDESILDVGCGNGRYLSELQTRGHRGIVCGADLSAGMLRTARSAAGDDPLLLSDAQALPFALGFVRRRAHDAHAVPRARSRPAIGEIRRVVRPGGVALVLTNY